MIIIDWIKNAIKRVIHWTHKFWEKLVGVVLKVVSKIKEKLGIVVQGTKTFIQRTVDGFKNISKYYNENKLTGEWEENIYTKPVLESDVPPEILAKANKSPLNAEVSTDEELSLELGR